MLLAKDGLPNGGTLGYELFDQQSGFGTTKLRPEHQPGPRARGRTVAHHRRPATGTQLSRPSRLCRNANCSAATAQPASAAVFLTLRGLGQLEIVNKSAAIQSLVASSVPELKAQSRSPIIDSNGNLLAKRRPGRRHSAVPLQAEEMRHQYDYNRLTGQTIEDMVGRVVGYGHVHATVTADLDFDRVTTNQETYDPNGQVARSTQTTSDKNSPNMKRRRIPTTSPSRPTCPASPAAMPVAAPANFGPKAAAPKKPPTTKSARPVKQSACSDVGAVKHLSIAVLVDGTYTTVTDKDGKDKTYKPRSQAELDKISALGQIRGRLR